MPAGVKDLLADQENEVISANSRKLLLLLNTLRKTESGKLIYKHAEQILRNAEKENNATQQTYSRLLTALLDGMTRELDPESEKRLPLELLQVRLQPPLCPGEFDTIKSYLDELEFQTPRSKVSAQDEPPPHQAPSPVKKHLRSLHLEPSEIEAPGINRNEEPDYDGDSVTTFEVQPPPPEIDEQSTSRVDILYRHHLTEQHKGIQKLEQELLQKIQCINSCHEKFGLLLVQALDDTNKAETIEDIHKLRRIVIREAENMARGNQILSDTLQGAFNYLEILQKDGQRLTEELARVHLLSLTDDLTGLPNRRAFLRHLGDEISRSERYGFPLSIAIIDLDHFKSVNDQYGHPVGDAVLRNYAKNIFTILRNHDIVSRYGGEEFAVMLPNTQLEKALTALNKVLFRARKSRFMLDGASYSVPTISVGLTQYKHGEDANSLLERADKAMYHAKELGRNRIITNPHTELQPMDFRRRKGGDIKEKEKDESDLITWTPSKCYTASEK